MNQDGDGQVIADQLAKPRIQFVRSHDGVNLGAWKAGAGPPVVLAPHVAFDINSDWNLPTFRWYRRIAQNRTLISFDRRGGGASDRDTTNFSLDALVGDLEAVVEWAGVRRFALIGAVSSGPVAIAYAVRHPDRVSHLVLFQTYACGGDFHALPGMQAARALLTRDWEAFVQYWTFFNAGWADTETAEAVANRTRQNITQESMLNDFLQAEKIDVTGLLPLVQAPTLVVARRRAEIPPVDVAKALATAIPDGQLALFEGERANMWDTDSEEIIQALERFTAEEPASPGEGSPLSPTALAGLTERELDVLRLVAEGNSNKEIAGALSLSVHTVERHVAYIYAKFGARGRAEATGFAHRNRLV